MSCPCDGSHGHWIILSNAAQQSAMRSEISFAQAQSRAKLQLIFHQEGKSFEQPKDKVFGQDIPGTPRTQMSGYPGQKLYAKWPFSVVFIQGVAAMSRDLGRDVPDLEKIYARKLWADFSFPISARFHCRAISMLFSWGQSVHGQTSTPKYKYII